MVRAHSDYAKESNGCVSTTPSVPAETHPRRRRRTSPRPPSLAWTGAAPSSPAPAARESRARACARASAPPPSAINQPAARSIDQQRQSPAQRKRAARRVHTASSSLRSVHSSVRSDVMRSFSRRCRVTAASLRARTWGGGGARDSPHHPLGGTATRKQKHEQK